MSDELPQSCFRKSPEQVAIEREAALCGRCIFHRIYWGSSVCALTGEFSKGRCGDYEDTL